MIVFLAFKSIVFPDPPRIKDSGSLVLLLLPQKDSVPFAEIWLVEVFVPVYVMSFPSFTVQNTSDFDVACGVVGSVVKDNLESSKCASCLTAHSNSKLFALDASTQIAAKLKAETADKVRIFVFVFLFIIQGLQYKFAPNYK